jgi:hypothetical protein
MTTFGACVILVRRNLFHLGLSIWFMFFFVTEIGDTRWFGRCREKKIIRYFGSGREDVSDVLFIPR